MAKRLDTHNRFAAELDSAHSRLDELSLDHGTEAREGRGAGWRRNLAFAAIVVAVAAVAMFIAR
ncbi:hypothetical protein J7E62_26380 [Variovorax paradoxus]|nr:hypothetical protein [Variovorax paradoxus]